MKAKNVESILRAIADHYGITGIQLWLQKPFGVVLSCPPHEAHEGQIAAGETLELALLNALDRIHDAMSERVLHASNAVSSLRARVLELDALRTEIRKGVQS